MYLSVKKERNSLCHSLFCFGKNRLDDQLGDREKRHRRESTTNRNGSGTSNLPLLSPLAVAVISENAFSQEVFRGFSHQI